MQACVIIPVWNGAASIAECLRALLATDDERVDEIVCVDNASTDGSAALIAAEFPQVRLLSQPVNLGFAGGVNAGVAATQAEMIVLLNQDCLVQPGWREGFMRVFEAEPGCGAVGCVIFAADGSINHAGAQISRPLAYGVHVTTIAQEDPYPVDYATGAFFACRRSAWRQLGGMDDQYYPAYFEESDFCYRLRRQGFGVLVAPGVRATHLFTSREWQRDPVLHNAQQHRSRYRFVCKQFTDEELLDFFAAEQSASIGEPFFHQSIGRVLASRDVLRHLPGIAAARRETFDVAAGASFQRVAEVKFGQIYRAALHRTQVLAAPTEEEGAGSFEDWQQALANLHAELADLANHSGGQSVRDQQLETLDRARHLYQEIAELAGPDTPLLLRVPQTVQRLQARLELLFLLQQQFIAAHDLGVSRLDREETKVNQHFVLLNHRLDLIENQLTLMEYRRRVSDLLAEYEQF